MSHQKVYRLFDEVGVLLYVGRTADFTSRLANHQSLAFTGPTSLDFYDRIDHWVVEGPMWEAAAEDRERALIRDEAPLYNRWRPHPVAMGPLACRWPALAETLEHFGRAS